ncbi:hypothetical protein PT974_10984 [Cladobotryum mycophilum]|uniref:Mid2 domain-containing protein n=1 Tax=Cladobotryum mycophilum TaxID=491253 RepID=A0ABR0SBD2_9HYPO
MSLLLSFVALFTAIAGVYSESSFSQPPAAGPNSIYRDNPRYKVGQEIDLQWTSDLEYMDLLLWQQYPSAQQGQVGYTSLLSKSRSTSLIWTVDVSKFSTNGSEGQDLVYFLGLYKSGSPVFDTTSHYFNVSQASAVTSSSASGTASATTPPSSLPTLPTPPPPPPPAHRSGLSTGAVAGISIGGTLVGILIAGALVLIIRRSLLKRGIKGQDHKNAPYDGYKLQELGVQDHVYEKSSNPLHELP